MISICFKEEGVFMSSLLVVNSLAYKYSHSFYEVLHKLKQSLNIPILFITQQIPKQLHTSITYLEDQSLSLGHN
ncbi:hypothetical protein P8864_15465, partial [Priestia flexa]|uniref:hypothetical protein n=1 Tax=Priestia flexa TaxID=86664 RepID=UPI002DBC7706